eukprot:293941-Chlamydomonas_euryale.AAC.1
MPHAAPRPLAGLPGAAHVLLLRRAYVVRNVCRSGGAALPPPRRHARRAPGRRCGDAAALPVCWRPRALSVAAGTGGPAAAALSRWPAACQLSAAAGGAGAVNVGAVGACRVGQCQLLLFGNAARGAVAHRGASAAGSVHVAARRRDEGTWRAAAAQGRLGFLHTAMLLAGLWRTVVLVHVTARRQ